MRRWPLRVNWHLVRWLGFGAAVGVAGALIFANYLSEADKVANIVSALAAVATLWLTHRAFRRPGAPGSPESSGADRAAGDASRQRPDASVPADGSGSGSRTRTGTARAAVTAACRTA